MSPFVLLAAGLVLRAGIFGLPHREGDEKIYAALIEQVRAGQGYTLQGHPILAQDWMIAEQYDTPLFYHPPAGVAWMALLGPDIAQLAAFVVFFIATWGLARDVLPDRNRAATWTIGLLAAATPVAVHVSLHRWLDGPLLAATAAAAWILARALARGGTLAAVCGGAAIGVALLVKLHAAVALPGIAALAWVAAADRPARDKLRLLAIASGVAALLVTPWLVAEFRAFGTIFPAWAGRPSARLVAENPFIRQVTEVRSAWSYVRLVPTAAWSLVPALAIVVAVRPRGRERATVAALVLWIVVVIAAAMGLGAIGYSKLLRYVVPAVPATVLLAGYAASKVSELKSRRGVAILGAALAAGIALEVSHGVQVAAWYPERAWVRPLFGPPR